MADDIFTGKGRTKKEAKKAAAVTALSSLYSEKVAMEGDQTRHTAREDEELPPNFKMKHPVQV